MEPSWIRLCLKALKNDKRFIFSATARAQRAVNYLRELQDKNRQAV